MFSRSLLLVLLVLTCLQSFTTAQDGNEPAVCCYQFQKNPIPLRVIAMYTETERACTKPGVIFTLKRGHRRCADPEREWVQNRIKDLDQHLFDSLIHNQMSV